MSDTLLKVAVVQASPVLFDQASALERVSSTTAEASKQGARLILFPEALVPGYPRGLGFGVVVGSRDEDGRHLWQHYHDQAVLVPGPATELLGEAASRAQAYLAVGVVEREGNTLYCTTLYFGPDGRLLGLHRKLKPTAAERIIWGEGDGSTLTVFDTPYGKVGGLTCWENYMPLARTAMYAKGVAVYLAPTADSRDCWQASLRHIAREGGCFVLGCNQYVTRSMYPEDLRAKLNDGPEVMCRGGSAIVSPMGDVLAGPLYDNSGILYADLDLGEIIRARFDFDVMGHYDRPDVFQLHVDERARGNRYKK